MSHIVSVATCVILSCVINVYAQAPASQPAGPGKLEFAQLQVLSLMNSPLDGSHNAEIIERAITRFVKKGFPRDAFERPELNKVALRSTANQVRLCCAAASIAIARGKYGIDPEDVYSLLPKRTSDAAAAFREYIRTKDNNLLRQIHAEPLDPESVRHIIAVAEESGSAALTILLGVLQQDWSKVGRAYLYRKLTELTDPEQQKLILSTLTARQQVDAVSLGDFVRDKTDDAVLRSAFQLAELSRSDPEAKQFLAEQLLKGGKRQKELAMQSLTRHGQGNEVAFIITAISKESNPDRRADLLQNLGGMAAQPKMLKYLRETIAKNSSPKVRLAALKAIPDYSIAFKPEPPTDHPFDSAQISLDELRGLGAKGDTELRDAIEDKIARVKQQKIELDQRRERHREKLKDIGSQPGN